MRYAALIPTLYRPEGLTLVLQSLTDTAPEVDAVVAREADDFEAQKIAERFGVTVSVCELERAGCAYAWNTALRAAPNYDAYVIASDDMEFLPNWLEVVKSHFLKLGGSGLVGMNAGWKVTKYAIFYAMTRDFILEHHGGVAAIPHYKYWGVDTEASERAMRAGKFIKTKEVICLHHKDKAPPAQEIRDAVKRIYKAREATNFPDDFERILCE